MTPFAYQAVKILTNLLERLLSFCHSVDSSKHSSLSEHCSSEHCAQSQVLWAVYSMNIARKCLERAAFDSCQPIQLAVLAGLTH